MANFVRVLEDGSVVINTELVTQIIINNNHIYIYFVASASLGAQLELKVDDLSKEFRSLFKLD